MSDFLLRNAGGGGHITLIDGTSKIILLTTAPPSSLTAVAMTKANILSQNAGGTAVPVATIGFAWISWPQSSLAGGYYEVGRVGEAGSIAHITNQATPYFADFSGPRNVPVTYQLRTVDGSGAPSGWTSAAPVTVPVDPCVLTVACNEHPDEAFACQDQSPYDWQFSHEDSVVLHKIYGRNTPVGFRPAERGGDVFTRTLIVANLGENSLATSGRVLFDPVVTLIRDSTVAYVAVCDGWGRIWLTTPRMTATHRVEPGGFYTADVQFVETSDILMPTVTAAPWHY